MRTRSIVLAISISALFLVACDSSSSSPVLDSGPDDSATTDAAATEGGDALADAMAETASDALPVPAEAGDDGEAGTGAAEGGGDGAGGAEAGDAASDASDAASVTDGDAGG